MTRTTLHLLLIACFVVAGRSSPARAQGAVAQPPPSGSVSQPAATAAADETNALKALMNSPEARSVAAFRCSSGHSGCPLDESSARTLTSRFDDTLLTGTGASTPLIQALEKLLAGTQNNDAVWPATVSAAIVHLVKFSDDGQSNRGRWLLFERKGTKVTASTGTRIMGSKRVAIVFVHLDAIVRVEAPGDDQRRRADAAQTAYADVEYRAIAKPKLPINLQRLLGLLRIAAGSAQARDNRVDRKVAVLGFGVYSDVPVPSDLTVFGAHVGEVPLGFGTPMTYDNEGKYLWDASVAVPINKITLLDYVDTEGTFTPKAINKQSIYGTVSIYPFPVDIKDGWQRWVVPRAMVGIGMTGRPGENFLLAGALGIKEIQIFVGSGFANRRVLKPGADPTNGASYTQRYSSRLTYGINVPVAAAVKKLAGGK